MQLNLFESDEYIYGNKRLFKQAVNKEWRYYS
jgi:hypothetical protein